MRKVYLDQANPEYEFRKLSFYSPSQGYVASGFGPAWVGFSSDTGRTFTKKFITLGNVDYGSYPVNLTFGFTITGVKAFDQNKVVAYGDYGFVPSILYSNNGGASYTLVYHSQFSPMELSGEITDMVFPQNSSTGFAVDADRILKTTNQGTSWAVSYVDHGRFFTNLEAVDDNTVFAFSTHWSLSKLVKTTNAGASWQTVTLPNIPSGTLMYAHFIDASTGWLNMRNDNNQYFLYKTTTGGNSWTLINDTEATPFYSAKIKFVDANTGYALMGQNTVYKTLNGGVTWEPLSRDNDYSYLGFSHVDLQCISPTQLWACGKSNLLELSTNGGGTPLPQAYFKTDTTGMYATNTVNLLNYSRTGYSYKWLLNGTQISTSYNASYTHTPPRLRDTITLIVSDGALSDTTIKYQDFFQPVVVTSFTPTVGTTGTLVTITGNNLGGATGVRFGGTNASGFLVTSGTQVLAQVGSGSTGAVSVTSSEGTGSLPGFTYYAPPSINLPTTVSDTILCKSESIIIYIQNSQQNVKYELLDSLNNVYGSINGNGGTAALLTVPISRQGTYNLRASHLIVNSSIEFTNTIFIYVEKTRAVYTASKVNIATGEKVNFTNQSVDAATFSWAFQQDASTTASSFAIVPDVYYGTPGTKTLTLIAESPHGCRDTINGNAVHVYTKPIPDASCYAVAINDSDFAYFPESPASINKVRLAGDNGYFISGFGNRPKLNSHIGELKELSQNSTAYFGKYSTDGVLSWLMQIKRQGNFYSAEQDGQGNIYVAGSCVVQQYLTLPNGDSLKISTTSNDIYNSSKRQGFVIKLDSIGNYIWHTVITDPSGEFTGYPVMGGLPTVLKVSGNDIYVAGEFLANLGYSRNGVNQTLVTLQNSTSPLILQNNFVLKIRSDGTLAWHMYYENLAVNQRRGITGFGVDGNKNCYITGFFENSVTIHDVNNTNNVILNGSNGTASGYLLKFDSTGHLKWKVSMGISKTASPADIVTDNNGNSYLTGQSSFILNSTQTFPVNNSNGTTTDVNLGSYFLFKFDSSGMYRWGVGSRYSYYGGGAAVILKGDTVYTTGMVSDNGVPFSTFTMTSADGNHLPLGIHFSDFFIAKYDTAGKLARVIKSGENSGGHLSPNALVIDSHNNIIISCMADNYNGGVNSFTAFNTSVTTRGVDGLFFKLGPAYCYSQSLPVADAGSDRVVCSGDTTRIGAPAVAGYNYLWTSSPAGYSSTVANPLLTVNANTSYFLVVTNEAGAIARDTVVITTLPSPIADAGADRNICPAASTIIGAAPTAGYSYSWSSQPPGFTSTIANPTVTPSATTSYYLSVENAAGCIRKDTVVVSVGTMVPAVSISTASTTVCVGSSVTFTAIPVNGGGTPSYQWQVNSVNAGTNSAIFVTSTLANGDRVRVILTSSSSCASPTTANSNQLTMAVTNQTTPSVLIAGATSMVAGQSTIIVATPTNGGNTPQYQWQDSTNTHTWQNIPGATASSVIYTPQQTGNKIRCLLTSNAICPNPQTVNSNTLVFTLSTVTGLPPVASVGGIKFYPNPAHSSLFIDSLKISDNWQWVELINVSGTKVAAINIAGKTKAELAVGNLPAGHYIAILRKRNGVAAYLKFIKQ